VYRVTPGPQDRTEPPGSQEQQAMLAPPDLEDQSDNAGNTASPENKDIQDTEVRVDPEATLDTQDHVVQL
jgi:hypothetical protein